MVTHLATGMRGENTVNKPEQFLEITASGIQVSPSSSFQDSPVRPKEHFQLSEPCLHPAHLCVYQPETEVKGLKDTRLLGKS